MAVFKRFWLEFALFALFAMIIASAFIPCVRNIWIYGTEWNGEATRSIVLALGAIGAFYGLILAARRLDISQKQAEVAEANLFNERLSRSIEAIGKKTLGQKRAGIELLAGIGQNYNFESYNKQLLIHVLHGFALDFGSSDEVEEETIRVNSRCLRRSVDLLSKWVPYKFDGYLPEQTRWTLKDHPRTSERASLIKLNFNYLNFQQMDLRGFQFMESSFVQVNFMDTTLLRAKFYGAIMVNAVFLRASLRNTDFSHCNLSQAIFANLRQPSMSVVATLPADIGGCNFSGAMNLTQEQLDSAVFEKDNPPLNLPKGADGKQLFPDDSRAYEWIQKEGAGFLRRLVLTKEFIDAKEPSWFQLENE